jgi:hypothetical protein
MLELHEQMREMNARLERIGAHVERIDARMCRMEREGPCRAPPAGDAPGALRIAVRARTMHLLDLPAELLAAIATQLAEDDELVFALACRRLCQAVAGTQRRAAGVRLSTSTGSAFCSVGKLAVASCRLSLSGRLLLRAARAGQLELLSWLRTHGCAWEPCKRYCKDPCSSAAAGGHLLVLQWARADGSPWDEYTCSDAAAMGHLHVLQWARANGCLWRGAAKGGHLAVLQWLHANGCPWNEACCRWCAAQGAPGCAAVAACQWLPVG